MGAFASALAGLFSRKRLELVLVGATNQHEAASRAKNL
jgi:hypothetical protein